MWIMQALRRVKLRITSRLRNQLIFVFAWVVLFIVLIPAFVFYKQTTETIEHNFITGHEEILKLVNQNLDNYLSQLDDFSLSPRKDEQFMNALYSGDYLSQFYIQNQLRNLFYSRDDVEELSLYTPASGQVFTISRSLINLRQESGQHIPAQSWYQEALGNKQFRSIRSGLAADPPSSGTNGRNFLTYHRILINISDKRPLAAISITLNTNELQRIIGDLSGRQGGYTGFFDEGGVPYYLSGPWNGLSVPNLLAGLSPLPGSSAHLAWRQGRTDLMAIGNTSLHSRWRLVTLTPTSVLNEDAARARRFNLLLGGGLFVLFIVIVILVSGVITRRLKRFSQGIYQLGDGNFNVITEIDGTDEIANLSRKFNQMMLRINELIKERYEIELNEKNARLEALEAQINPHFLYNALQALSTKAIQHGLYDMYDMVEALASTLRYCIKEGDQVKINDEVAHVTNYFMLQKARFGARLHVEYDLAPDIMTAPVPKMLLQVLAENAIKHGLEQMSQPIRIHIEGWRQEELIVLRVRDNGPGMSPERLAWMTDVLERADLPQRENIGLTNVSARLKLMYGSHARLRMSSTPGQGTEVQVKLPFDRRLGGPNV
ncbi:cache domain-containing sensor histidine kinase [Paenibacillus sp. y28]|uniref:cache domain-containing sensor histidine kinase n=1 Tax=Paenibacillus sp. y28 TaxID=3129110 RepID=UPI00301A1AA8